MRFPRNFFPLPLAALCLLLFAVTGQAQNDKEPEEVIPERPLVMLNILVMDNENRPVTDLRAEDFRVLEEGKPQNIYYFAREELAVSYGIVADATGSMRTLLAQIIEAGRNLVASNKPADETFVMRFVDADTIDVLQGFTSNRYALEEALDGIYIKGGLTALNDAINQALDYFKKSKQDDKKGLNHKALILISDGEDRGSRARNQDALLNRLREEGIQFFIIGLTKISGMQGSREKAANFLTRVAEVTGGRAFFPKSTSEIPGIVSEVARDLRTQYVIGYRPTNLVPDGSFRKVQVTVNETPAHKKLKVITRPGYTAPRP